MTPDFPKRCVLALVLLLAGSLSRAHAAPPRYDHVVVVIEENETLNAVIGNRSDAPYINSLADGGASFTHMRAVNHPSQPNYLEFFSGNNQGVTDDTPFSPNPPLSTPNLAANLMAAGFTFTAYADALPHAGDTTTDSSNGYARRHCPWIPWITADPRGPNQLPSSIHQPYTAFPTDFTKLPDVSFVIPSNYHNMHDSGVYSGDAWLRQNLYNYAKWAKNNNSLLIVTWDEDNFRAENLIPTIFYGAKVRTGINAGSWTLHNLLRTLEDMYAVPHAGRAATVPPITGAFAGEAAIGTFRTIAGEQDTMLSQSAPDTEQGEAAPAFVSGEGGYVRQGLLKFDGLFSPAGPLTSEYPIVSAKLIVSTFPVYGGDSVATIALHRALTPWDASSTWNGLGEGMSIDGIEAAVAADATAVPGLYLSNVNFEATAGITAWQAGAANYGWLMRSDDIDAWAWRSTGTPAAPDTTSTPVLEISGPASSFAFTASTATVKEADGSVTVTVRRGGDLSRLSQLAYSTIGSTATADADFTSVAGVLTWAAGDSTSQQIVVPILADGLIEKSEVFTIALAETAGPVILESPSSVTVTISAPPMDSWKVDQFGADGANTPVADDLADPDGDGIPNLLEYACVTRPTLRNALPITSQLAGGFASISFVRPVAATDLVYTVQGSSDLQTWQDGSTYSVAGSTPSNGITTEVSHTTGGWTEQITVRDNTPNTDGATRFLRLKIARVP